MLALRLSRTATQLVAYWQLSSRDILKLSGGKESPAVLGVQAACLLVLTPLTQMQQALSCLLPFRVMLPVSCKDSTAAAAGCVLMQQGWPQQQQQQTQKALSCLLPFYVMRPVSCKGGHGSSSRGGE
jgi:hypothetical protein